MKTNEEIKHAFAPVGGLGSTASHKLMKVEAAFKECATEVLDLVPDCADREFILRQLLGCKMWASQAISHELPPPKKAYVRPKSGSVS